MTAPQDDREAEVARIAAVLHEQCDWEHYMGHEPSERDDLLAIALYDAGLRAEPAEVARLNLDALRTAVVAAGYPDVGSNAGTFTRLVASHYDELLDDAGTSRPRRRRIDPPHLSTCTLLPCTCPEALR